MGWECRPSAATGRRAEGPALGHCPFKEAPYSPTPSSPQIPQDSHWGSCRPLGESQVIMPPKAFHASIFKAPVIKVGPF